MTTNDDHLAEFMAQYDLNNLPNWESGEDLARLSRLAAARTFGGVGSFLASAGSIRLSGAGVTEHSVAFESVGEIMATTQRLVTAIGASLSGFKALTGAFASDIAAQTALGLVASPGPGSVVLEFGPAQSQIDTEYPDGQVELDAAPESLVDQSFDALFDLVQMARESTPDTDEFVSSIEDLGPRVATSLRTWTESLKGSFIDAEISWVDIHASRRTQTIERAQSSWISAIVAGNKLDAIPAQLAGTVRTVSDVASWTIDVDEGSRTSVKTGELSPGEISSVKVGDRVRLAVLSQEKKRPGAPSSFTYTATGVEILQD